MTAATPDPRAHLAAHRRMIIARSVLGSLAAMVPVPFLDDRAITAVIGGGYHRIAAARAIALPYPAQLALVHGVVEPPGLGELAGGEIAFRLAGDGLRRAMIAFALFGRAQSASRTFVTMTLFDHFCAHLHAAPVIDTATAVAVREEIDRAIDLVPSSLWRRPFHRAARSAARAAAATLSTLTRVDDLEHALDRITDQLGSTSHLARLLTAADHQLTVDTTDFLDRALDALDRGWPIRLAAGIG